MAWPLFNKTGSKQRDQVFAVDFGGRVTKAVCLQRKGGGFSLSGFGILDTPIFDKTWSADLLSEHLKAVAKLMNAKTRYMSIAIDVNEMVVRTVDMPSMPVNEIRQVLRVNGKAFLQQELPNHVFDCCVFPASNEKSAEKTKAEGGSKTKVLVAGAKRALLDDIQIAIKNAGFIPDVVIPSIIGPVNAFENAMPEVFPNEVIALVDIGFRSSTISLLQNGRLALTRIVNMGGDKLTSGLAEMMNITYAEAEGIKIGMPGEVQPQLEVLVSPIGRELRASIDFFEHQQDRAVSAVYISGGTAQSTLIVQAIQTELALECKTWNPTKQIQIDVPTDQAGEMEHVGPQLTVALGTALTAI